MSDFERYEPKSAFLKAVAAGNVPLSAGNFGDDNLLMLMELMSDDDRVNRDWATFLLAQTDLDTSGIRGSLLRAAIDEDSDVRAEAICGLAKRDAALALPFVQAALQQSLVTSPIFEAAKLCADPSLVNFLRPWTQPSDTRWLDDAAKEALEACRG